MKAVADLGGGGGGGGGGGAPGAGAPPLLLKFITLFSSLLACCRYVATPGLASSGRNTVRCLKPNGLGTRPRFISSHSDRVTQKVDHNLVYPSVYVRITFVSEI